MINSIWCCVFMMLSILGFADRGIAIPCNDKYMKYVVPNLQVLRGKFGCELPIEIWHAGDELSTSSIEMLKQFEPIEFRDIVKLDKGIPKSYRGYQIKGYTVGYTGFDEVMLVDADVCFFQNPEILFDDPEYKNTGAYLFRDQGWGAQGGIIRNPCKRPFDHHYYYDREAFFLSVIKNPSKYCPQEWTHYWDPEIRPTEKLLISLEHGESGCVLIDKKMHRKGIQTIVDLNRDFKRIYKIFLGDKETFWTAFEIRQEPYTINSEYPKVYLPHKEDFSCRVDIVQFYKGNLFYQQKMVHEPLEKPIFFRTNHTDEIHDVMNLDDYTRPLLESEIKIMQETFFISKLLGDSL